MSQSLYDLLQPSRDGGGRVYGVVVGIVTNNKDPDGLGRVKLKFPWLSDTEESNWARVASPMAGKERGLYLLPEVNDQLLVAFEHGDPAYPYVIGGLWNGKDKPPAANNDGKNNLRLLKSRSGHIVRLDDTEGEEKIEILDKSGKNSVVVSTKDNSIAIKADADIKITSANGKLVVDAKGGIELKSSGAIKVEASGSLDLKANGQTTIKGSAVNIN
jgi:uncharacterized protein involved in type VI secretion and phage assembly